MNHQIFFALIHTLLLSASVAQSQRPLEGLTLRCCAMVESPIVFEEQTGKHRHGFAGIAIEYLSILEERLGFRCEPLKLFEANKPENQGFTGFIMELEECTRNGTVISSPKCQCDFGVGGWTRNRERLGRVDFLPSFINDDRRMLTHVDNITFGSTGAFFITAFSATTWMAICVLIVCFIFLKLFDRRFAPPDDPGVNIPADASWNLWFTTYLSESRLLERLRRATQSTLLAIIGQPRDDIQGDAQNNRQWLLTYILILCGLFLVLAYEATMTASLVQEKASSEFRTIEDLKKCRVPAKEVCIPAGGAAFAFWQSAIAKTTCNQGVVQPTVVDSYEEGHRRVANKECKYFLASGATTRDAANGRYCGQVATTGEPFFIAGVSMVLPRGSHLTEHFSSVTLELRELDAIDSIDQFLLRRGECDTGTHVSLTFGRLKMFFVTAFSACGFMFLIMVFYPQGRRQGQNRQNTQETDTTSRNAEDDKEDYTMCTFETGFECNTLYNLRRVVVKG